MGLQFCRSRNRTGAAFLVILGTLSAGLCFAAYNDLNVTYRGDGMILCNGEPFFPVGVYYIPCPNQRTKEEIENLPRATFFQEFAANGGNFLVWPSFHFDLPAYDRWDDYFPCDVTDNNPAHNPPNDCLDDLRDAEANGIKILPAPSFAYDWEEIPESEKILGFYVKMVTVDKKGKTRSDNSRFTYFNQIKGMVETSGAEDAYFGLGNFHESAWRPWKNYFYNDGTRWTTYDEQNHVYRHLRDLEENAGGTRPVVFENAITAIVCDLLRQYDAACDILGYNVRIFTTPHGDYNYINNRWASITGDTADVQFWSVDGAKPVYCCVDAVWFKGWGDEEVQSPGGYFPWLHQVRFMAYDAVIHRCNGLTWGAWHNVYPPSSLPGEMLPRDWYEENIKPSISEMGLPLSQGGVTELLTAAFDETLISAVVTKDGADVERTAFVGGELAPKTHNCSSRYLMEGAVKFYDNHVYLIAACREGRNSVTHEPVNNYAVTFKPYFSGTWADQVVTVVNEDIGAGQPRTIPVINGTFTDTFQGEDVHIYKFTKPPRFGEGP